MKSSKKLAKKLLKKVKKEYKLKRLRRIKGFEKNKKSFFIIESPYNSNEYLIEIQSTPFSEEEEEEEKDFNFFPNEFNNFNIDEKKDFSFHNESTSDCTNVNNELMTI